MEYFNKSKSRTKKNLKGGWQDCYNGIWNEMYLFVKVLITTFLALTFGQLSVDCNHFSLVQIPINPLISQNIQTSLFRTRPNWFFISLIYLIIWVVKQWNGWGLKFREGKRIFRECKDHTESGLELLSLMSELSQLNAEIWK